MFYEKWCSDATVLTEEVPTDASVMPRLNYLLDEVAQRAIYTTLLPIEDGQDFSLEYHDQINPLKNFFLVNKGHITADTLSQRLHHYLTGSEAFVLHWLFGAMLALDHPQEKTVYGNGMVLFHELQHLTDREDGIIDPTFSKTQSINIYGRSERRAYGLNADIFRSIDDSKYDEYALYLNYRNNGKSASVTDIASDNSPHNPYRPPKGTFLDEVWQEGEFSRRVVLLSSVITSTELYTWQKGDYMLNTTVGKKLGFTATANRQA